MRGGGAAEIDGAIDDYLDHLTSERGVARNTMEAYARDLAAFAGFLARRGVRAVAGIGPAEMRGHVTDLAGRGLSPRSQARALAAVHGFVRFLVRERRLPDDPAAKLRIRRPPPRPGAAARRAGEPVRLRRPPRARPHPAGDLEDRPAARAGRRPRPAGVPPHDPAHLRDAPADRWGRPARRAGAARARRGRDHPDLHARHAGAVARGPPSASPPGVRAIVSCAPQGPSVDSRMPTSALVAEIALLVVPVLAAIVFHEVAHGAVAYGLGDPTAARHGRLT